MAERSAASIRRWDRFVTLTAANAPSASRTRIPRTITSSMAGDPTGGASVPLMANPPIAKRVPHVHRAHGDERPDDYHWLRNREDPDRSEERRVGKECRSRGAPSQ